MSEDYKCEGITLMCESYPNPSISMCPWGCIINSLYLCFVIYKMRIMMIIILQGYHESCIYMGILID